MPEYLMPAFIRIPSAMKDGGEFSRVEKIMDDPELREEAMDQAYKEIEEWRMHWGELFRYIKNVHGDNHGAPGTRLVKAIDKARKQLGVRWPTLPDDLLPDDE